MKYRGERKRGELEGKRRRYQLEGEKREENSRRESWDIDKEK